MLTPIDQATLDRMMASGAPLAQVLRFAAAWHTVQGDNGQPERCPPSEPAIRAARVTMPVECAPTMRPGAPGARRA